jgi:DNA-binding MarR family transcriptional regulator
MNDSTLVESAAREGHLDRLLDLQPRMRQRFDALLPRGLCATVSADHGGVTQHQLEVLHTLARRGRVTMNELATLLGVGPSSATQLVDRLINRELVERHTDPADRRLVWIVATPRAGVLIARFAEVKRELVRALSLGLTDAELATLVALLAKLAGGPHVGVTTPEVGGR